MRSPENRVAYHDAVICGAIERHSTMAEAIAEICERMPWSPVSSIRVRAYWKRRKMVERGRIDQWHGIVNRPTAVSVTLKETEYAP